MKCDICNERDALIFIHQISVHGRRELRLCVQCAKEYGVSQLDGEISQSLAKLMDAIVVDDEIGKTVKKQKAPTLCSHCGMTLAEMKKQRSAGCVDCWTVFSTYLLEGRLGIQGLHHKGRLSVKAEEKLAQERKYRVLQARLEAAVASEAYEEAAALRDDIQRMGTKGGTDAQ